jgi:phosphomannomutase
MMLQLRRNPLKEINGQRVLMVEDYENSTAKNLFSGETETLEIPKSNVLIYYLEDGTKICARPSGTEPKIKFYFSVNEPLESVEDAKKVEKNLDQKIKNIIAEMHLQ